jgi:hypothetical protein
MLKKLKMSDIIFKTNGKEGFRIPFPTPGTRCPETKLEIKMTEPITLNLTLDELKLIDKYVEFNDDTQQLFEKIKSAYPRPRMEAERSGEVHIVFYNKKTYYRIEYTDEFGYVVWWRREKQDDTSRLVMITDKETERLLEGLWFNEVKRGVIDEPEHYDEVEWDEKDNPKPMDEVVDRLIKKYQAQKLRNMLKVQLDYDGMVCDDIVDIVEDWILDEQSASGSQNVNTELLVEGFNDAIRKMKEMLR